jgi:hypothetical protein
VCYIFSLFVLLLFLSFFFPEDLTVVRIKGTTGKETEPAADDISSSCGFLYNCVTWRFLLMYFFSKVSVSFLVFILAVVFFIVSFSRVYCLEFVSSFIPWLLASLL